MSALSLQGEYPIKDIGTEALSLLQRFIVPIVVLFALLVLIGALIGVVRQKLREAGGAERIRFIPLLASELLSSLCSAFRNIIPIIIAAVILCVINDAMRLYKSVNDALALQRQVAELQCVVKNLSRNTDIARITNTSIAPSAYSLTPAIKHYRISILSPSGKEVSGEDVTLVGNEIYIDSCVLNFDYSQVASGGSVNVAWPYRVYSERMAARDGIPLKCVMGKDGVPTTFRLSPSEIYGLDERTYDSRLTELLDILKDGTRRREAGIRAFIGSAVHLSLGEGESCLLRVEGIGGISLKREDF